MAHEYSLELSTLTSRLQALELLASQIHVLTWGKDRQFLLAPTIMISASEIPERWRGGIQQGYGFAPTLSVGFRFVSDTDFDNFRQIMLQATILLLEQAQDGVLLYNGEITVLQRLGGQLVINYEHNIWDDENWLKSRITIPFELRPLSSPLL